MKSLATLLFCIGSISVAWATVRTVSNDPTRLLQFNGKGNTVFVAAHNASLAGNTIYAYSSPFDYGILTINKRLVVIGAGYGLDNSLIFTSSRNYYNILFKNNLFNTLSISSLSNTV